MVYIFFFLVFVFIVGHWLAYELKKPFDYFKCWRWLAAALVLQAAAHVISFELGNNFWANILLHSIGGGMAATCLFFYLVRTFGFRHNWRIELVVLFMFVSTLGTMNELGEFAGELVHFGKFSFDTHDTWRDLASNTGGMLIAWLVIRAGGLIRRS